MSDRLNSTGDHAASLFQAKADWHRKQARIPIKDKIRILLELQRQDLSLIRRHRQLEWWERPWEIDP